VVNYEVDGVTLNKKFQPDSFALNVLQDSNADILGSTWAGVDHIIQSPPFSRIGMLVAKYFGKGRVISVGSMGWMPSLLVKDKNVVTLTKNFLDALTKPAEDITSTVAWNHGVDLKNSAELGVVHLATHETIELHATCSIQGLDEPCLAKMVGDRVVLEVANPVTTVQVTATILGDSGYRIYFEPKEYTATFTQP